MRYCRQSRQGEAGGEVLDRMEVQIDLCFEAVGMTDVISCHYKWNKELKRKIQIKENVSTYLSGSKMLWGLVSFLTENASL